MSFADQAPLLLAVAAVPVLVVGCGKKQSDDPETAQRKHELEQIYEIYSLSTKQHGAPKQLSDLVTREFEQTQSLGVRVLREGAYVVVWGVTGKDSGTVLAYEKDAPKRGGFVLMADGSVEKLTADELNGKLK